MPERAGDDGDPCCIRIEYCHVKNAVQDLFISLHSDAARVCCCAWASEGLEAVRQDKLSYDHSRATNCVHMVLPALRSSQVQSSMQLCRFWETGVHQTFACLSDVRRSIEEGLSDPEASRSYQAWTALSRSCFPRLSQVPSRSRKREDMKGITSI